jgi:xanthine dehydrogenase accessory factor
MKELRSLLSSFKQTTFTKAALATLVQVEGSSYRRAGARLLWREDGTRIGSISGGCLEEDVIQHCRSVLAEGKARTVVYDTTDENDLVWGVGLGCNGIVRLLIEPLSARPPFMAALEESWEQRTSVVIAHVFSGAAPEKLGAAIVVSAQGILWQALHPQAAAPEIAVGAREALTERHSTTRTVSTLRGSLEVFFEYVPPPLSLLVFGAGDDAQPLARLAAELGWEVSVFDPRPAFAQPSRFPEASRVVVQNPEQAGSIATDDRTVAVVMTHHYLHDVPLMKALLPRKLRYLGLLGPKKRAEKILAELAGTGIQADSKTLATLHAPVGLDLGGTGPENVALSILAEIQAALAQRNARPLRERDRPIHG